MQKYLRGQIWWYRSLEEEEALEPKQFNCIQKGVRPVLIVSNNAGNRFSQTLQVIPCTTSEKTNLPTHYTMFIEKRKSTFLCEQLKTIMKSDLTNYMGTLDENEMNEIEKCLKISLGIKLEEINILQNEIIGGNNEISSNRNSKNDDNKD